jgi:hypothetical protein
MVVVWLQLHMFIHVYSLPVVKLIHLINIEIDEPHKWGYDTILQKYVPIPEIVLNLWHNSKHHNVCY